MKRPRVPSEATSDKRDIVLIHSLITRRSLFESSRNHIDFEESLNCLVAQNQLIMGRLESRIKQAKYGDYELTERFLGGPFLGN